MKPSSPTCEACGRISGLAWQLVEIFPDRRTYEVLCRRCRQRRDTEFTAALAIDQLRVIVTACHQAAKAVRR